MICVLRISESDVHMGMFRTANSTWKNTWMTKISARLLMTAAEADGALSVFTQGTGQGSCSHTRALSKPGMKLTGTAQPPIAISNTGGSIGADRAEIALETWTCTHLGAPAQRWVSGWSQTGLHLLHQHNLLHNRGEDPQAWSFLFLINSFHCFNFVICI